MIKFARNALLAMAVTASGLVPLSVEARDFGRGVERHERHGEMRRHDRRHRPDRVVRRSHRNRDAAIVAGIAGLAIGAMIADSYTRSRAVPYDDRYDDFAPARDPGYYPPAPARNPDVVYAPRQAGGAEPWSREWYRYCENRYRSFDAGSGTFMGYDGKRHFCVAP
ncbi:BA14K family protein [Zhengella sp. ZM62]|uniref:BA14K family protein n=1 Tax=Zhengella sedimenti TaxID=3390035 RepID=UPI0039765CB0